MTRFPAQSFQDIRKLYEKKGLTPSYIHVGDARWSPKPFEVMISELIKLHDLSRKGKINDDKKLLIAGSGDGREAAYFAAMGYEVLGIEIIPEVAEASRYLIAECEKEGYISKGMVKIVEGSFLDDDNYLFQDTHFSNFKKISAYLMPDNLKGLVNKMISESPSGTSLLTFSDSRVVQPQELTQLQNVDNTSFKDKKGELEYILSIYNKR